MKEEVINKFLQKGLFLINPDEEYINNRKKIECYDKDGYKYLLSVGDISDKRTKKFKIVLKENKFSIYNIELYIKLNGYKTKILSDTYNKNIDELLCLCECGKLFKTTWNHINCANKFTCTECGIKKRADKRKISIENMKELCLKHNLELVENEYIDSKNIVVKDKDGYFYRTTITTIRNNGKMCKFHKLNPHTLENMKLFIKLNNIPISINDNDFNNKNFSVRNTYIPIYCSECGNTFNATWSQITLNKRYRCEDCSKKQSYLSVTVEDYLKEKNIKYEKEYRFNECKDKRCLPFDFYLNDYNTVIEVQGEQHYYENDMFSQTLEERKEIDKIKKDYCLNNNIIYIEIPFSKIRKNEKYKEIINNILS